MEIRNDAEALKAFLGVSKSSLTAARPSGSADADAAPAGLAGDKATFSQAAAEVSQAAAQSGVRTEKVAAVQQALAAGTYRVPASAVAEKMIEAMVGGPGQGN